MAKPYFRINSATYSSNNLTVNYTFYRNRGSVFGGSNLTVTGISSTSSLSFNEDKFVNLGEEIQSLTVVNLSGGARTGYTDPSALTWTFGGTPSTTSNVKLTIDDTVLGSTQLCSVTASSSDLATFLSAIAASVVGNSSGVSLSAGSTTLSVTVPSTGNKFNNKQFLLNLDKGTGTIIGTSSFGLSGSATFSGGVTNFSFGLSSVSGGYSDTYEVSSITYSMIP